MGETEMIANRRKNADPVPAPGSLHGSSFGVAAAGAAALGGSLIYIGILAERIGERLVKREP